jgi:hypothetical protein
VQQIELVQLSNDQAPGGVTLTRQYMLGKPPLAHTQRARPIRAFIAPCDRAVAQ